MWISPRLESLRWVYKGAFASQRPRKSRTSIWVHLGSSPRYLRERFFQRPQVIPRNGDRIRQKSGSHRSHPPTAGLRAQSLVGLPLQFSIAIPPGRLMAAFDNRPSPRAVASRFMIRPHNSPQAWSACSVLAASNCVLTAIALKRARRLARNLATRFCCSSNAPSIRLCVSVGSGDVSGYLCLYSRSVVIM
jgi:hypothetical protein